jgi:valyl-tRNA synthetase
MSFAILDKAEECNQFTAKLKVETENRKKAATKSDEYEKKMIELEKLVVQLKGRNKKGALESQELVKLEKMYQERCEHLEEDFQAQKSTLQKMIEDLCLKIENKEYELKEAQNLVTDRNFVLKEKRNELEKVRNRRTEVHIF